MFSALKPQGQQTEFRKAQVSSHVGFLATHRNTAKIVEGYTSHFVLGTCLLLMFVFDGVSAASVRPCVPACVRARR